MKIKLQLVTSGILLSFNLFAYGYYPELTSQDQPWSVIASFGNVKYQNARSEGNQTALGRLALGNEIILAGNYALGLELGLQTGNHMLIEIPYETLAVFEWFPVRTTLGPMLDLLITAKSDPLANSAFFAQIKGGVAYRSWQVKQVPVNDISQLAGEIQAGFGYPITALANLNLLYQGVFGNDPKFKFAAYNKMDQISNIPTLHAVLLGLSVNL